MSVKTYKINEIEYDCEFLLKNADDQEVNFTKSAVRGMRIEDNFFSPFKTGSISIANPYDFVELDYLIRGDGRDTFKILFYPTDKPKEKIEKTFIIVGDSNNVNPNVRSENIKTFYLVDDKYLPFMEKIPYNRQYSGKVGDILKDVFIEVLGEEMVDKENWESGDFELTYIPPLSFRYIDLLNYLIRCYYATDEEIQVKGFINFDDESGKYKMQLLSKIFAKNKDNLLEAFGVGDLTDKVDLDNPNNPPAEAETGEYIGALKNIGLSTPMYSVNNNFFLNSLVHGYDKILGVHNVRKITIEDLEKKWKKKFVDVFKTKAGKPKPFLVYNKITKEKYKEYRLPYNIKESSKIVEAEMINNFIFYNLQIAFSNLGSTIRKSGKFIDVYKTSDRGEKSDSKMLGRWFVSKVIHVFFADTYQNEIMCCKTYVGTGENINKDVD